jgi:ATP-dependent Clp protease ATP-binding subunit ClpC
MNEYVSAESAARLVGTFYQPEGLLTSAVQRRPFAVVLLDEIEKAHPDVFDLLLQVLGEGRLTDALGRTVDFTNTIIILTSNLGVRAAEGSLGFRGDGAQDDTVFVQAAEKFFRPEFFNRLDRIVPFSRLSREEVGKIARLLIQGVFQREGLQRRKCILEVDDGALERVVDQGYNALLGARALKRAIERQLTQPVAARLAELPPGALTVVSLYPRKEALAVQVQELRDAGRATNTAATIDRSNPAKILEQIKAAVARIEGQLAHLRPTGAVTLGSIDSKHLRYFRIKEQAEHIRDLSREVAERLEAARLDSRSPSLSPALQPPGLKKKARRLKGTRYSLRDTPHPSVVGELAAAQDIHEYLKQLAAGATRSDDQLTEELTELLRQTALLELMAGSSHDGSADRAVLYILPSQPTIPGRPRYLASGYRNLFGTVLGLEVTEYSSPPDAARNTWLASIRGPHALSLARFEEGTHLFCAAHQNPVLYQVGTLPLAESEDPLTRFAALLEERRTWLERVAEGQAEARDNPLPLLPVLRVIDTLGPTVDVRTGMIGPAWPEADALREFFLSALPLPPELLA